MALRAASARALGVCPLVIEYSRAEQTLIAEEVVALPEDAQIVGWLADYAALREQVKACVRT